MTWRLLVLAAALPACATVAGREAVCPEYRDLRCASTPVCTLDQARGCDVCRCEEWRQLGPPGYPPPGPGTPDRPAADPPAPWTPQGASGR
jgi:hypothetical protein